MYKKMICNYTHAFSISFAKSAISKHEAGSMQK